MNAEQWMGQLGLYGADLSGTLARFLGDEELYLSCLRSFLEDGSFAVLQTALEAKDYRQAFEEAHSLKGVTGNLGLTPLYQACCQLVDSLRSNRLERVDEECAQVLGQMERLKTMLRE